MAVGVNVLVVGSGGREHALVSKLNQSPLLGRLVCAPGNAGTASIVENIPVQPNDQAGILQIVDELGVDLVVVGPEAPLAAGLADTLWAAECRVFGPGREAARIESSKAWAKALMLEAGVPTGRALVFHDLPSALGAVTEMGSPVVIKADGLAAGKGVLVCQTAEEAEAAVRSLLGERSLGEAGASVLIEEFLSGQEVSLLVVTDGETYRPLMPACDYKRVNEGDAGPNTGGMGAYAPPAAADAAFLRTVSAAIIEPTLAALRRRGLDYRGVLYAGLILTADGPKVIEFNCRFGDPETQVVLPMLESDLLELCLATAEGRLSEAPPLQWRSGAAVGVVLASGGYPGDYQTGYPIHGLDQLPNGGLVFHAGTGLQDDRVVTAGGRVLTAVGLGPSMAAARDLAYATAEAIHFEGRHFRRDIALREV
jgi:phosphoribosylamine--glycine ligase